MRELKENRKGRYRKEEQEVKEKRKGEGKERKERKKSITNNLLEV